MGVSFRDSQSRLWRDLPNASKAWIVITRAVRKSKHCSGDPFLELSLRLPPGLHKQELMLVLESLLPLWPGHPPHTCIGKTKLSHCFRIIDIPQINENGVSHQLFDSFKVKCPILVPLGHKYNPVRICAGLI
jgi:hypothetical protein